MGFVGRGDKVTIYCAVCREVVDYRERGWVHPHSGDAACWTGDGATALPGERRVTTGGDA